MLGYLPCHLSFRYASPARCGADPRLLRTRSVRSWEGSAPARVSLLPPDVKRRYSRPTSVVRRRPASVLPGRLALYGEERVVRERDLHGVTELPQEVLEPLEMVIEAAPTGDHHRDRRLVVIGRLAVAHAGGEQ